MLHVGDTNPERKLKPNQVPLFPEETIKRHDPIELDIQKFYPDNEGNEVRKKDNFVSSE